MTKYEYRGESFQVQQVGDCHLQVTDGNDTVLVKIGRRQDSIMDTHLYEVYLPNNDAEVTFTSTEIKKAVEQACAVIVRCRTQFSYKQLCDGMKEFLGKLN